MIHARNDYNEMGPLGIDEKIPDDEPVFLLRAQDVMAIPVIETWCELAREAGVEDHMIVAMEYHIRAIEQWRKENPGATKIPDMPRQ